MPERGSRVDARGGLLACNDARRGIAVAARDRVVRWSLASGVLLAVLAWHFVGPWASLASLLLALATAAVAYRIEAPRIDVEHPEGWATGSAGRSEAAKVDQ
jgi:hypothetical protein